jgi:signal transduction histidine kinase/PAS domain-containing protein
MSPSTRLGILVVPAAVVLGTAASLTILVSDHLQAPALQALLTALTGGSFIAAGLVARIRRPENRTGLLLIAVGFAWFLSTGLMGSDDSLAWTLGLALSAIPAGFLIHLLIAYPSGRLHSLWERTLVVAGYVLVAEAHFLLLPFDPDPMSCADTGCPNNAFFVSDNQTWRDVANWVVQLVAVVYLVAVVATLVARWRQSSPAARRALAPVLLSGATTLFLFAVSVGTRSISETVSTVTEWTAAFVVMGVPFLFLTGLLKGRLARAEISRMLAEEPVGGVQERVRELLHDPTAELLYACADPSKGYIDCHGRRRDAVASPGRAVTLVERGDRPLAAMIHDEALLDEPELLEQVAAAVGLEIERDKNLFALQASEMRSRALLEALPDKIFRITEDGIVLDIQDNLGWPASPPTTAEVGKSVYDAQAPRELIERLMATGRRALRTGELQTTEWEWGNEGDLRYGEGRFIPSGDNEFLVVSRDITDRKRQELERAALHRVALAVASEAPTEQIFNLVAEEMARVLGAHTTNLVRYDPDGETAVVVGGWRTPGARAVPVGDRRSSHGTASQAVGRTGRPLRRDRADADVSPELAELMRELDINSLVAAPIKLASRPWGAVVATLMTPHSFAPGAEERLGAFTRLISLALANEEARAQLAASRARLVTAGDQERRRLERNLHDGAQQRLVSVSVSLRLAQTWLEQDGSSHVLELLSEANEELGHALEELRELARGIHPAVLTERGLGPALASLANRASVPVEVEGLPPERLPDQVEAAAYYVVSEALANVAKHADASSVTVRFGQDNGHAVVEVVDDGVGGANPGRGSGLHGLADRIESLDGYLRIESPPGEGTTIRAEIPCR